MSISQDPRSGVISARTKGRLGELLAAISLESLGVDAVLCDRDGYDIIANDPIGGLLKVEVKSAHSIQSKNETSSYKFYNFMTCTGNKKKAPLDPTSVDVVALVCVPERKTIFKPIKSLRGITTKIRPELFNQEDVEYQSWKKTIRNLQQN